MGFIKDAFMLRSEIAVELFSQCKNLPICDYHCHLSAEEIYNDETFQSIYAVWLKGDHYKWRLMRLNGVPEKYITNVSDEYESFLKYCATLELAIDSPLYHWSHLELLRCFNISDTITLRNAPMIWEKAEAFIAQNNYSPREAISQFNVTSIVTTEEVYCDLKWHQLLAEDKSFKAKVLPAFRADKIILLDLTTIHKLASVTGGEIADLSDMIARLNIQLDRFVALGAIVCDLGIDGFTYIDCDLITATGIYNKAMNQENLTASERLQFASFMTLSLLREYYTRGLAVQIHVGASRNNNSLLFDTLGADIGCDSISTKPYIDGLTKLFDILTIEGLLGKTMVYNLNPNDNYIVATMLGNFASEKARMQLGMAWWFADNKYSIIRMLNDYSSLGHLGSFIGMLTDSRSFLSYTRHEYFRRILCNHIAELVIAGEYPNDLRLLVNLVKGISYNNAIGYFGLA